MYNCPYLGQWYCTPKLQKCQFLNNGALGLSLPGSEEMLCQTINAEFIQKALGRAAHVIFCYQLQHVTIRSVPCDVPFYGNTTSFFSSYCAVVCCMELHARSNMGLFFYFFSTTSAHMLVITSASLNFRHNVLIVCMLLFSLK